MISSAKKNYVYSKIFNDRQEHKTEIEKLLKELQEVSDKNIKKNESYKKLLNFLSHESNYISILACQGLLTLCERCIISEEEMLHVFVKLIVYRTNWKCNMDGLLCLIMDYSILLSNKMYSPQEYDAKLHPIIVLTDKNVKYISKLVYYFDKGFDSPNWINYMFPYFKWVLCEQNEVPSNLRLHLWISFINRLPTDEILFHLLWHNSVYNVEYITILVEASGKLWKNPDEISLLATSHLVSLMKEKHPLDELFTIIERHLPLCHKTTISVVMVSTAQLIENCSYWFAKSIMNFWVKSLDNLEIPYEPLLFMMSSSVHFLNLRDSTLFKELSALITTVINKGMKKLNGSKRFSMCRFNNYLTYFYSSSDLVYSSFIMLNLLAKLLENEKFCISWLHSAEENHSKCPLLKYVVKSVTMCGPDSIKQQGIVLINKLGGDFNFLKSLKFIKKIDSSYSWEVLKECVKNEFMSDPLVFQDYVSELLRQNCYSLAMESVMLRGGHINLVLPSPKSSEDDVFITKELMMNKLFFQLSPDSEDSSPASLIQSIKKIVNSDLDDSDGFMLSTVVDKVITVAHSNGQMKIIWEPVLKMIVKDSRLKIQRSICKMIALGVSTYSSDIEMMYSFARVLFYYMFIENKEISDIAVMLFSKYEFSILDATFLPSECSSHAEIKKFKPINKTCWIHFLKALKSEEMCDLIILLISKCREGDSRCVELHKGLTNFVLHRVNELNDGIDPSHCVTLKRCFKILSGHHYMKVAQSFKAVFVPEVLSKMNSMTSGYLIKFCIKNCSAYTTYVPFILGFFREQEFIQEESDFTQMANVFEELSLTFIGAGLCSTFIRAVLKKFPSSSNEGIEKILAAFRIVLCYLSIPDIKNYQKTKEEEDSEELILTFQLLEKTRQLISLLPLDSEVFQKSMGVILSGKEEVVNTIIGDVISHQNIILYCEHIMKHNHFHVLPVLRSVASDCKEIKLFFLTNLKRIFKKMASRSCFIYHHFSDFFCMISEANHGELEFYLMILIYLVDEFSHLSCFEYKSRKEIFLRFPLGVSLLFKESPIGLDEVAYILETVKSKGNCPNYFLPLAYKTSIILMHLRGNLK